MFPNTYRYYHGFPCEASGRLFREAAMSMMRLRHLMYHIVHGQRLHVSVRLIGFDHRRRWHPRNRVLAIIVVVVIIVVIIIVVLIVGVVIAGIRCGQLLHFHGRHSRCRRSRRHGRRHRVFGAAFPRTFRHPAVSHGYEKIRNGDCRKTLKLFMFNNVFS